MAKILVTGGAGFIGSHLVDLLIQKNHKVIVVDDLSCGNKKFVNSKAVFIKEKVQSAGMEKVFKKYHPQFVYHLAAQKSLQFSKKFPFEDAETNILGSLRVIEMCKKYHAKKNIFFSSAAVYDSQAKPPNKETDILRPVSAYGIAKRTIEDYLTHSGLRYTILRPSNVYGPRQDADGEGGVVAIFCKRIVKNTPIGINNSGKQTRDFIYVYDVIKAAFLMLTKGDNETFNVSSVIETSVNELFSRLKHISQSSITSKKGIVIKEQLRSALQNYKIKKQLGWEPSVKIEKGLQVTLNFFA